MFMTFKYHSGKKKTICIGNIDKVEPTTINNNLGSIIYLNNKETIKVKENPVKLMNIIYSCYVA